MAITKNVAIWQLEQMKEELGREDLDPQAEHIKEQLDLFEVGDVGTQGQWEVFCNTVNEAIEEKVRRENGGELPDEFTLPYWPDYHTVLRNCPDSIKNPPPMEEEQEPEPEQEDDLLAPPDVMAPPPPTLFEEPPTESPEEQRPTTVHFKPEQGEEVTPHPIEGSFNQEEPSPNSDPPDHGEQVEEPEEKQESSSMPLLWAVAALACMVVFLAVGWSQNWFSDYDNQKQSNETSEADDNDNKVTVDEPTDASKQEDKPAPPPVTPTPTQKQPVPAPEQNTAPSGETINVVCDVGRDLVGRCKTAPRGCTVGYGMLPSIRATCGDQTYCSRFGGDMAASMGDNVEIKLKKSWCKSS